MFFRRHFFEGTFGHFLTPLSTFLPLPMSSSKNHMRSSVVECKVFLCYCPNCCIVYLVLFCSKLYFETPSTGSLEIQIVPINEELTSNRKVVFDNNNQLTNSTVTEKNKKSSQTQEKFKSIETHRTSFGTEYSISF
jgi:hypothetical protein